jgi:hypothetical protein
VPLPWGARCRSRGAGGAGFSGCPVGIRAEMWEATRAIGCGVYRLCGLAVGGLGVGFFERPWGWWLVDIVGPPCVWGLRLVLRGGCLGAWSACSGGGVALGVSLVFVGCFGCCVGGVGCWGCGWLGGVWWGWVLTGGVGCAYDGVVTASRMGCRADIGSGWVWLLWSTFRKCMSGVWDEGPGRFSMRELV